MAKTTKKKAKKNVVRGVAHVFASFNNTIVTISDPEGNTVATGSSGAMGFKGTRKSTPFAAMRAGEKAAVAAIRNGMKEINVRIKGAGSGRESSVRSMAKAGLKILSIEDVTPLPHNGCRAKKRRRT
ncbi:MAG: 30S ribosomal protein S11 [Planctomycetota bacterium]|jgi:small subunit ribosomal protein S11|nr:30S ribosomal protein S11 [Planctomycetota bacterium]